MGMNERLKRQTRIFGEILTERSHQDKIWGGLEYDDNHSELEWNELITDYNGRGAVAMENEPVDEQGTTLGPEPSRWRKQMIRVAALALAAVESFDRRNGN